MSHCPTRQSNVHNEQYYNIIIQRRREYCTIYYKDERGNSLGEQKRKYCS